MPIYLEDLSPGMVFTAGPAEVTEAEIIAFAQRFDPQPFHIDPEAAKQHPIFRGLAASGWHTAAMTMRMVTDAMRDFAGGTIGGGGDLQWPKPVRPGDLLRLEIEVLEVAPSRTRPERGSALMRNTTFNQNDEAVQIFTVRTVVPRRPAG